MIQKKVVILTGNDGFFGQTRKPWVSMNVKKLEKTITEHGFEVKTYTFSDIVNGKTSIENSFIFYTFHQKPNRRNYSKDVIHFLNESSNIVIPSYDLLLCHENKGFQELYKKRINLKSLKSYYFSSVKELQNYTLDFPVVLKTTDSSNGKGVFLAKSEAHLLKLVSKLEKQNLFTQLDLLRRKYFRQKKSYDLYPDYSNEKDYYQYRDYILKESNFILQEFVPNLNYDHRVLILFDKYYIMKRFAFEGDFRASGTKIQKLDIEVDYNLMEYAREIYSKLDTPFLSIDIGSHKGNYCLFEFQAHHFGINVFVKSKGYYTHENNSWKYNKCKPKIETEIASGLVRYINSKFFS